MDKVEYVMRYPTLFKLLTSDNNNSKKAYENDLEAYEVLDEAKAKLKEYRNWDGINYTLGRHLTKAYMELEMMDME